MVDSIDCEYVHPWTEVLTGKSKVPMKYCQVSLKYSIGQFCGCGSYSDTVIMVVPAEQQRAEP